MSIGLNKFAQAMNHKDFLEAIGLLKKSVADLIEKNEFGDYRGVIRAMIQRSFYANKLLASDLSL